MTMAFDQGEERVHCDDPAAILREQAVPPRAWTPDDLTADVPPIFYDMTREAKNEIADALRRIKMRGLHPQNVEQQDFRVPSFARDVPMLRDHLDRGCGFVVLRGLDVAALTEDQALIVYWGLGNYLGRVMRQDLSGARTDFVSDKEEDEKSKSVEIGGKIEDGGWDPYRVIDTNKFCTLHTDNAYSNPRPPDYVGLMCLSNAAVGGESLLMSAYTLHNQILEQHPEYLERLYQDFSWDTPPLQTLPDGPPTKAMPIFEFKDDELVIHYLDLYLEPGMERAGTPMTPEEKEIQAFLDAQMLRDDLMFRYLLQPGETLFFNNRWNIHGRDAFEDTVEQSRKLVRLWMWRRHTGPGMDPVALDAAEFGILLD